MSIKTHDCAAIAEAMHHGGYFERIMQSGPELDRVKAYLRSFEQPALASARPPDQSPDYPLFPGLRHRAFWDEADLPAALQLQAHAPIIHDEWAALTDDQCLRYTPTSMHNLWQVHLLHYMGIDLEPLNPQACPKTHALLRQLPGICLDYPWGDALLSVHASDSHLRAHCSVDNLRVRCHLGLQIPPGCCIRVGQETMAWQEGKVLLFEDSFEHEVWNRGDRRRAILIVDFWHPDLTPIEIEALTAGFCKREVRQQFMYKRLQAAHPVPERLTHHLQTQLEHQEARPPLQRYWSNT